jgi:hypothetical protein
LREERLARAYDQDDDGTGYPGPTSERFAKDLATVRAEIRTERARLRAKS